MDFQLSKPLNTCGDYTVRKVTGTAWDGWFFVVRETDQDLISVHRTRHEARLEAADFGYGWFKAPMSKEERLALLADVSTEMLQAMLANTADTVLAHRWRIIVDIRETLSRRGVAA